MPRGSHCEMVNKSRDLACVVAGVFFTVVESGCGEHGEVW